MTKITKKIEAKIPKNNRIVEMSTGGQYLVKISMNSFQELIEPFNSPYELYSPKDLLLFFNNTTEKNKKSIFQKAHQCYRI